MDQLLENRIRRKLEKLQHTSLQRYDAREHRITTALEFSLAALEKLEGWALFAIFPCDEQDSEKYIRFVDQRFRCVAQQLQGFKSALRVCEKNEIETQGSGCLVDVSGLTEGRTDAADLRLSSSTHCATGSCIRNPASGVVEVLTSNGYHSYQKRQSDIADRQHSDETFSQTTNDVTLNSTPLRMSSLSDQVMSMAERYVTEGRFIQGQVSAHLALCRQRLVATTHWALESVSQLGQALDEPLADELFYAVRGRLSRILADAGVLEEAVTEIDRLMEKVVEKQTMEEGRELDGRDLEDKNERRRTYSSSASDITSDKGSVENGDWLGNYVKDSGVHELHLSCINSSSSSTNSIETCQEYPYSIRNQDVGSVTKKVSRIETTKATSLHPKLSLHEPSNTNSLRVDNYNSNRRASDGFINTESFNSVPTNRNGSAVKWVELNNTWINSSLKWEEPSISKYMRTNEDIGKYMRTNRKLEPIRPQGVASLKLDLEDGQGNTPEPPNSPRPNELNSHPRIIKDKLCSIGLSLSARSHDRSWL